MQPAGRSGEIGGGGAAQDGRQGGQVVAGRLPQGGQHLRGENRLSPQNGGQFLRRGGCGKQGVAVQGGFAPRFHYETARGPPPQRNPHQRPHLHPVGQRRGEAVKVTFVDREGGNVGNDADRRSGVRAQPASRRNAAAWSVASQGNSGRPKWP